MNESKHKCGEVVPVVPVGQTVPIHDGLTLAPSWDLHAAQQRINELERELWRMAAENHKLRMENINLMHAEMMRGLAEDGGVWPEDHTGNKKVELLERELAEALAVLLRLYDILYGASDGPSMHKALNILERHGA